MQIWSSIHSKLNEKKLKKYEKNYKLMKDAEALKEDPLIRYERECKRLTNLNRRMEQENDDLANEYIDSKIALSKQLEELRDEHELMKNEFVKYKTDTQNQINESTDTNKKLLIELEQLKLLWRKQSDKYESELERNNVIISEYKQICNKLSNKIEKWSNFKRRYEARGRKMNLCIACAEANKIDEEENRKDTDKNGLTSMVTGTASVPKSTSNTSASSNDDAENVDDDNFDELDVEEVDVATTAAAELGEANNNGAANSTQQSPTSVSSINESDSKFPTYTNKEQQNLNKIKSLEMELARIKLELVDAQCKNQEYDHKLKGILSGSAAVSISNTNGNGILAGVNYSSSSLNKESNSINSSSNNLRSMSSTSQNSLDTTTIASATVNSGANGGAANGTRYTSKQMTPASISSNQNVSNANANNWFSKTITQFKEATNQVVQKAQKVKMSSTTSLATNEDLNSN
jgi:hypothetical protein